MSSKAAYSTAPEDDFEAGDGEDQIRFPKRRRGSKRWVIILLFLLVASCTANIVFLKTLISHGKLRRHAYRIYSGLPIDASLVYRSSTDYWNPEKPHDRAPDAIWDALNTQPVAVALDRSWATEHSLPVTDPWPWDDEKGLYYIKAFHNLHCVKIIRQAYHYALRGEQFTIASHHIDHCFDALRQDIMCRADDTPMPVNATEHSIGNGQKLQCRDWNKLVDWTQHPDRQACYNNLGDYEDLRPSLELFAFCPKDSKYYDIMSKYFEKFGHRELWASTD